MRFFFLAKGHAARHGLDTLVIASEREIGVTNIYPELGTTFANSAAAKPRWIAALPGTFIKGAGADSYGNIGVGSGI